MSGIPKRIMNRRSPPRVVSLVEGIGASTPTKARTRLQTVKPKPINIQEPTLTPIHISLSEVQRLPQEASTELPLSVVTSVDSISNQEKMTRTLVPRRPALSLNNGSSRVRSVSSQEHKDPSRGLDTGKGGKNLAQRRRAATSFQNEGSVLAAGDLQIWRLSRKVRSDESDDIRIHIEGNQGARLTFHRGGGGIIQDLEIPPDAQPADIVVPVGTMRFTLTGLGGEGNIPSGIEPGAASLTSIMSTRNRTFIGFQRNSLVHQIGTYRFLCRGVFIEADGTPSMASFKDRNVHKALDVLSRIDHLKVVTTTHVRTLCIVTRTRNGSSESLNVDLTGIRAVGDGTQIQRKDGVVHVWPISAEAAYSGPAIIEVLTDEDTDVHDVILSTSGEQSVVEMLQSSTWSDLIEEGAFSPHGYSRVRWINESISSSLSSTKPSESDAFQKKSEIRAKKEMELRRKEEERRLASEKQKEIIEEIPDEIIADDNVGIQLPGVIAFENYQFDISQFAGDHDEEDMDKLIFSKISGPDWLSIESSGGLSGVPTNEDVGNNRFVVRVTDPGGLFSDASVSIEVSFKELNRAPFWSPKVVKSNQDQMTKRDDSSTQNNNEKSSKANSKPQRRRRR